MQKKQQPRGRAEYVAMHRQITFYRPPGGRGRGRAAAAVDTSDNETGQVVGVCIWRRRFRK